MTTIRETDLLSRLYQGKVGDAHDLGDCLLYGSHRLHIRLRCRPAHSHTRRGAVLCQISALWFDMTKDIISKSTTFLNPAP